MTLEQYQQIALTLENDKLVIGLQLFGCGIKVLRDDVKLSRKDLKFLLKKIYKSCNPTQHYPTH